MPPATPEPRFIVLGHITRPHGVHGAFIIAPYTDNTDAVLGGRGLKLKSPEGQMREISGLKGKVAAQGLIVKINGVTTRDAALKLKGWTVGLDRADLPPTEDDEIYWTDLMGLEVIAHGQSLGRVQNLMEAGAGLLLVVVSPDTPERERLIPFQEQFIVSVEPEEGRLTVDPPPGLLDL